MAVQIALQRPQGIEVFLKRVHGQNGLHAVCLQTDAVFLLLGKIVGEFQTAILNGEGMLQRGGGVIIDLIVH